MVNYLPLMPELILIAMPQPLLPERILTAIPQPPLL